MTSVEGGVGSCPSVNELECSSPFLLPEISVRSGCFAVQSAVMTNLASIAGEGSNHRNWITEPKVDRAVLSAQ